MNYPRRCLPSTVEVCEPLCRLTSIKTEWMWNKTCHNLFDRVKALIKDDACIMFDKTGIPRNKYKWGRNRSRITTNQMSYELSTILAVLARAYLAGKEDAKIKKEKH